MGAFGLVAVFSYLRGFDATLPRGGFLYWQLTYEDGFIRRGLMGSLAALIRGGAPVDDPSGLILGLHLLMSVLLALLIGLWLGYLLLAVVDRDGAVLLVATAALLLSSQFLPTLGFLGGFLDGALLVVLVSSAALVASGRVVVGSLVAAVGPLVHETFIALWVPLALAGVALWLHRDGGRRWRCAWLLTPVVTTIAALTLHDRQALATQVHALVPDEGSATWIIDTQFHQSLLDAVSVTGARLANSWPIDLWGFTAFAMPAVVMVALVVLAYRGRLSRWEGLALAAAIVSPVAILAVATDISRFLVIVNLVTFTVVLMLLSRPRATARLATPVLIAVGVVSAVSLLMPLVYLDTDAADLFENGLLRIWGAPQSRS